MMKPKLFWILYFLTLCNIADANPRVVANAYQSLKVECPRGLAPTGCYEARNECRRPANVDVKLPNANDKWFTAQAGLVAYNLCSANIKHCPSTQIPERCCATQCVEVVGLRSGAEPIMQCLQACMAL